MDLKRRSHGERGQVNLTGLFIGILISGIVTMGVFIPVWNDVLASSNVTGTTKTILEYVPLFAGLMLLVAIAGPLMSRV